MLLGYDTSATAGDNTLVDANGRALATLPASAAAGADGAAVNITIGLRDLTAADYTALANRSTTAATRFRVEWSLGFPEYNVGDLGFTVRQSVGAGVARKRDARVNPIGNIADLTSTSTTMDGVVVVADNRVYLTDQTTGTENGLYRVASVTGANCRLVRAQDMDESTEVEPGTEIVVSEGTVRSNTRLTITNAATITIGTTALTHTREPVAGGGSSLEVIGGVGGITAGQIVYVSGFNAATGLYDVLPADADAADVAGPLGTPRVPLYVARAAILAGIRGIVHRTARLTAVNTGGSAVGRAVYMSTAIGTWTLTLPVGADARATVIGRVEVVDAATGVVDIDLDNAMVQYVGNRDLVPGVLAASVAGRALMATGFFDQVKALDAFGADSIDNAVLLDAVADGAFVADAATRALFANDFVTPALIDEAAAFVWTGNQTFSGGLFNTRRNIVFADSPYTPAATDNVILVDTTGGAITIQPTQVANRILLVKVINATAATTITPTAGLIDGQASWVSPIGARTSALLISDGTNMHVLTATLLNTALGRAHMADDFFTTAEMVAGAGGKFAPDCLDNVAVRNVFAADAFGADVDSRGAFVTDFVDAATADDIIATGALGEDLLTADEINGRVLVPGAAALGVLGGSVAAVPSVPVELIVTIADAAAGTYTVTLPADFGILITHAEFQKGAVDNGASANTYQIQTGAGAGITEAMDLQTAGRNDATDAAEALLANARAVFRDLTTANTSIAAGGSFRIVTVKPGGNNGGRVVIRGLAV